MEAVKESLQNDVKKKLDGTDVYDTETTETELDTDRTLRTEAGQAGMVSDKVKVQDEQKQEEKGKETSNIETDESGSKENKTEMTDAIKQETLTEDTAPCDRVNTADLATVVENKDIVSHGDVTKKKPDVNKEESSNKGDTKVDSVTKDPSLDEIPIGKGSYDIDFDKIDDSFNPFATKSEIPMSPTDLQVAVDNKSKEIVSSSVENVKLNTSTTDGGEKENGKTAAACVEDSTEEIPEAKAGVTDRTNVVKTELTENKGTPEVSEAENDLKDPKIIETQTGDKSDSTSKNKTPEVIPCNGGTDNMAESNSDNDKIQGVPPDNDEDAIPLSRGAYNIDFDNLDESFNPFATKTKVVDDIGINKSKPAGTVNTGIRETKKIVTTKDIKGKDVIENNQAKDDLEQKEKKQVTDSKLKSRQEEAKTLENSVKKQTETDLNESGSSQDDEFADAVEAINARDEKQKKPIFGSEKPVNSNNEIDNKEVKCEKPNENIEDMPLPRGTYNINFDDLDPDFNPFSSKSQVVMSPSESVGKHVEKLNPDAKNQDTQPGDKVLYTFFHSLVKYVLLTRGRIFIEQSVLIMLSSPNIQRKPKYSEM